MSNSKKTIVLEFTDDEFAKIERYLGGDYIRLMKLSVMKSVEKAEHRYNPKSHLERYVIRYKDNNLITDCSDSIEEVKSLVDCYESEAEDHYQMGGSKFNVISEMEVYDNDTDTTIPLFSLK